MKDMSRDRIKLSQIRALIAVAQFHNFSEAALHLEISQSAVSHAIASLEDELGVILFSRGRHGAQLTPVGNRVLTHAQQIWRSLDSLMQEAHLVRGLDGGEVRIASFRSVATHILPSVIAQFRQQLPGISALITEHSDYIAVERALRDGRADIGITYLPTSAEFEAWELFRDEYLVFLPPTFAPPQLPLTWEILARYPLITAPTTDACSIFLQTHFAKHGQTLRSVQEVTEDSTMISMVRQGLGVAVLPRLAAEPLPADLQIYSLPEQLERIIGVSILAEALHPPAVFAFLDLMKKLGQAAVPYSSTRVAG